MTAIQNRKKVNFKSLADLNELVINSISSLPKDITLVVAVPRSGYIVAGLIALNLNLPMCSYNEYLTKSIPTGGRRTKNFNYNTKTSQKVLIVDDSVSSGWEMRRIKEQIKSTDINDEMIFLAAYVSEKAKELVDIALEIINPPQIFEWNLYHHPHLINSCVDIDGVLCRDASKEEDDDGERYKHFLNNVPPRIIPTVEIGWLVTSRLEKYRSITENWLKKHDVKYKQLIMQDVPDLATRQKNGADAKFKADFFSSIDAFFFVESSTWQSKEIAKRTGKAVFCVDDRSFIQANTLEGKGWDKIRALSKVMTKVGNKLKKLPSGN
jgi:orotate phosphoribosyltransferase